VRLFFALLFPRALGFILWALALTDLRERAGTLDFLHLQGAGRKFPVTAAALVLAVFSVAGFPLLAGFPVRILLLDRLADSNLAGALGVVLGGAGLLVAGLRTLAVLVMSPVEGAGEESSGQNHAETPGWRGLLMGGVILLFLFGLFPHWLAPLIARLPLAFPAWGP